MQNLFDDFQCALKFLFVFGNHGYSVHHVFGMIGHIFSDICGTMGPNF